MRNKSYFLFQAVTITLFAMAGDYLVGLGFWNRFLGSCVWKELMFSVQFMVSFWRPGLFSACPTSSNPLAVKLSQAHSWKASTVHICVCPDPTSRLSWLGLATASVVWTVKVVPISIMLCQPKNSTPSLFAASRVCLTELANWSLRTLDKPGCPLWSLRYSGAFWNFIYC